MQTVKLRKGAKPLLRVVDGQPAPTPEAMLAELVPELLAAERNVVRLRGHVAAWTRLLATERRVAFIRDEHVRQEFGA